MNDTLIFNKLTEKNEKFHKNNLKNSISFNHSETNSNINKKKSKYIKGKLLKQNFSESFAPMCKSTQSSIACLTVQEDTQRRRNSTKSIFDIDKKFGICTTPPPFVVTSIMQAFSTTINSTSAASTIVVAKPQYKSYPQRWFVLATICFLALSNATQWMSFAGLHDAATAFYCVENSTKNNNSFNNQKVFIIQDCGVEYWTSQIFQIIGVLTGIFGMFITDRYGIRVSCFCGSFLNFAGALIRVISSTSQLSAKYRLPLLYAGQIVAATSQPFFLCLSPKVAEYWFAENQRTFANALSFIANPFGVVIGSAIPVFFVDKNPNISNKLQIFYLNLAVMILAFIVVLMTFAIRSSHPPTPSSASSYCVNKPDFFDGLFLLFKKPIFYIQTITFGMAFAIQWSFFITVDKLITKLNYFDKITGYLLPLSALSGSFASVLAGYFVDRTKKFKESIKFCYFGISIIAILFDIFLRHSRESIFDVIILVILSIALGFFSIPVFPISLELGVESTFPVAEATSSGILCISGQLQLFIIAFGMQKFESVDWIYGIKSFGNYQLSIDFWTASAIFSTIFSYIFLRPRYHRLEYEENAIVFSNIPSENSVKDYHLTTIN